MRKIFAIRHKTEIGTFIIGAMGGYLCYVGLPGDQIESKFAYFCKKHNLEPTICAQDVLDRTCVQLDEYLVKKRKNFDIPLKFFGTRFQVLVWKEFLKISYGQTMTYSQIAVFIGKPNACRAVGAAAHSNPIAIVVPCHRVIGKDGSLVGFGGGLDMKRKLLLLEGSLK